MISSDTLDNGFPIIVEVEKSNVQLLFEDLYDLDFTNFKKRLGKINYANIYFNEKDYLIIKNEKVKSNAIEKIGLEMKKYDLIFIHIKDNLSYQGYVELVHALRKSYFFYARKEVRLPQNYEVFRELRRELKKNDIKL